LFGFVVTGNATVFLSRNNMDANANDLRSPACAGSSSSAVSCSVEMMLGVGCGVCPAVTWKWNTCCMFYVHIVVIVFFLFFLKENGV
jgi:hypothetical protein